MIQFETNEQIDQEQDQRVALELEAQERQAQPIITSLAAHVRSCWQAAKDAKRDIESVMIESLRRKRGEYDPAKLREIREQGGSEIFMALTDEKCSAVSSWLMDTMFPSDGDKPWGTEPTPVPELSPEQMQGVQQRVQQDVMSDLKDMVIMEIEQGAINNEQQAFQRLQQLGQQRAESMAAQLQTQMQQVAKDARDKVESKLDDVVAESAWGDALSEVIEDIATFPCGVLKGPVLRRKKRLSWASQQQQQTTPSGPSMPMQQPGAGAGMQLSGVPGGQMPVQGQQTMGYPINQPPPVQVLDNVELEFSRISPLDIYPMPNARKPEDGIFERHSMTGKELSSLIGVDGFDDDAIRLVLQDYGRYGNMTWLNTGTEATRMELEDRAQEDRSPVGRIDVLQYWDNIQGLMLLEHGMEPESVPDPLEYYSAEVWLVDRVVIKAELNGDPLSRVPYHKASFRDRNGSFWGAGPPSIIKDSQEACNAAARNIINNMSISSGPQVVYDVSQMPVGMDLTSMSPWKIWQINGSQAIGTSGRPPVSFAMPPSISGELMQIYEFFSNEADTKLGVPKYTYGGDSKGGAMDTASGLSIMMSNATRGIKNVVRNLDRDIIQPTIERLHEWLLLYSGDPEYYAGDIKLRARGTTAMIIKEQLAVRRNELLQAVVGAPPILGIIGQRGLAAMLRDIFDGVDFSSNDIVPTEEELAKQMMQQQVQAAQQQQVEAQQQQQSKARATQPGGAVKGGGDARVV